MDRFMDRHIGVNTKRLSASTRLALVLFLTAALILMAVAVSSAGAGDSGEPTPLDKLCVSGTVINHMEEPITGWTVTAVTYDAQGVLNPSSAVSVQVDENGAFSFGDLAPGVWNFSIEPQEGWVAVTSSSFDVPLAYGMTECVNIRFKMRQLVTVTVLKIDADHTPLAGWVIHAKPGPDNVFAQPVDATTGPDGVATFQLSPGLWTFSESAPTGVVAAPVSPPSGIQQLNVTAPGPHTIRFKNRVTEEPTGCIEVIKRDVPPENADQEPFGLPDWFVYVLRADGSTAAEGKTDATGRVVFDGLPLGPYTVHETVPATGWEAVTPTNYAVTLTDSSCVTIEFFNRQVEPAYCIVGRKVDTNGKVGLPGWEISATPSEESGYTPAPVTTDGLGYFRIDFPMNDYRIPGATYEVCETSVDGWLAHTATCQTVTLPTSPGECVALGYDFENQQVGHQVTPPKDPKCSQTHVVKSGEGLYAIGKQYGKSPQEMLDANPWVRSQPWMYLYRGQKVCIP